MSAGTYEADGTFNEIPGTDGAIIRGLIDGCPKAHAKKDRRPALELTEIGMTFIDVTDAWFDEAQIGYCLRNACEYIRLNGGTLMIGRFHNLDHDTICCHAWVLTDEGQHVDPSGLRPDGIYYGTPDPYGWAAIWNSRHGV